MSDRWCDEELYAGLGLDSESEQHGAWGGSSRFERGNLRIFHVCKFFPPERGGMETYVRDLVQEQAHAGHDVTVLAHTAAASRRERMPEGYTLSRSRVWMRAGDYVPVAPGLAWQVWRALRSGKLDILHVHCPNPAALWCVLLVGWLGRSAGEGQWGGKNAAPCVPSDAGSSVTTCAPQKACGNAAPCVPKKFGENMPPCAAYDAGLLRAASLPKLVVHWHSDVIFPLEKQPNAVALKLWRRMEDALLARADRIIATSLPYLESSDFLAPWRNKCVVAPLRLNATRPEVPKDLRHPALDFLRGGAGETARAVLAVGRLAHYKGFDVLVRAVAASPTLRCCIIGEGEEGPKLHALVQELGVQDRVLLPGEVDDATLTACYEACDVFCLPSLMRTEAFGVVLLEALRAGKWCVVSDVPGSGMGTVIRHGENGWLVPPGDVVALGKRLGSH